MWNNKEIRKFKGRMIRLIFTLKECDNNLTGVITASTTKNILFRVNKSEKELIIRHSDITEIKELKTLKS